ncbi:hypothetical protein QLX08_002895 [Tetragonisca angustula]|uniref:HTH CENPB-type domain-containing protein n=1 Tax=Tetragonisca angustula TaxID=166442 RepID=A0AAW1ABZ3_9HYME
MANSSSTPSRQLNIAVRLDILKKLEAGENIKDLAREYNVTDRTIRRIRQNASSIRQFAEKECKLQRKRMRSSTSADLDKDLYSWVLQRRSAGGRVTDSILIEKAKAMQEESGGPSNFIPCRGWLWRFKKNYNLSQANIFSESERGDTNESSARQFIQQLPRIQEELEIGDDNLYNMDETSLFWRMLPKEVLTGANEKGVKRESEEKIKNDRVTLALCSNATGSHKLPLLLINKHKRPRALKHCINHLPVIYTHNENAWMNTETFQFWYHSKFKPCVRRRQLEENNNGKVLLIVDNFSGHNLPEEETDDGHFKIMFLPPNTSSLIQPMDQGVITKFKKRFRHRLLQRFFQYENGPSEFYADYDIKDCIDLIDETWYAIRSLNIFDSWGKILNRETKWIGRNLTHSSSETALHSAAYGTISDEQVTEWINQCEEAERIKEDAVEEAEESFHLQPPGPIEAEEIDRLLYYLKKITVTEPEIANYAESIIDYYNSK